jgi:hypothetical protein
MLTHPDYPLNLVNPEGYVYDTAGRVIPIYIDKSGYRAVRLYKVRTSRFCCIRVYRLVSETYIGTKPDGLHTRHLSGNKFDDRLVNLSYGERWRNGKDNYWHRMGFGRTGLRQRDVGWTPIWPSAMSVPKECDDSINPVD